jgi:hypothetical protein
VSPEISASVGRWEKGARNLPADVSTVQQLLKSASGTLEAPEIDPQGVDGKISRPSSTSDTVEAIEAFQSRFTSAVDGVIAPSSQTWAALLEVATKMPTAPQNVLDVSQWFFPFPVVPSQSWEERPRAFASPRAGGARLHAGCDLYFPKGTPIHAVAEGVVTRGPYPFYCETFALEIDHGPFLLVMERSRAKVRLLPVRQSRQDKKLPASGIWSGFKYLAICCILNSMTKACRDLLLWPVILARP